MLSMPCASSNTGTWTALIVPIPILQEDLTALLLEYGPDKAGALLWSMKWSKKKSEEVEHRSPKAGDDDDDLDLFADETEEEKKAAEQREVWNIHKEEREWKRICPYGYYCDDETDMKKLEEAVRSVEMPGILWGAYKWIPVGYGIKKMQIMLTIVDDLVSVDELIEERLTAEPCSSAPFVNPVPGDTYLMLRNPLSQSIN